jgi:glucose-6-phosphate 1-dehydrogenase
VIKLDPGTGIRLLVDAQRTDEFLLDMPPQVHPYKPGSWGPKSGDKLIAQYGGWHGPWIPS